MAAIGGAAGYAGLVTGALAVDLGIGRRGRALGPLAVDIGAPRDEVFNLLSRPYLGRPRPAFERKLRVVERGTDLVVAEHFTPVRGGLTARTLESVRFTRPDRIDYRLLRGPVPYLMEEFVLSEHGITTRLEYSGELATDLWAVGSLWGALVARRWQEVVAEALVAIKIEAERTTGGPAELSRGPEASRADSWQVGP